MAFAARSLGLTVLAPGSALVQRGIAELACTRLAGLHGDLHRAGTHADTSCSALRGYRAAAAAHPRMDAAQQARGSGACGAARLQRRDDTTLASDATRAHGPGPGIMGMGHALGTASAPPGAGGDVPQPHKGPWALFEQGLQHGRIRPDERQQVPMRHLQQLYVQLEKLYKKRNKPSNLTMVDSYATKQSSWFSSLLGATDPPLAKEKPAGSSVKGLYMWGGVGVGKTMLMDLFVEAAPKHFKVKRAHFLDFMPEVHVLLQQHSGEQDPLKRVADSFAAHTRVLCLDELFVNDVADAMILHRLFARLFDRGLFLVATSNRRPDKLYENGLQRQLFVPFIQRLEQECIVHDMDSSTDYRQLATRTVGVYFVRLVEGRSSDRRVESALKVWLQGSELKPRTIPVAMGRTLEVSRAAGGTCCFQFAELCGTNVGADDYIALVTEFHTLALKAVPVFDDSSRSTAYRFVKLVDLMYEHRTKLLISAEAYAHELFRNILTQEQARAAGGAKEGQVVDDNLGFSKDRTVSRLTEMQTLEYAIAHAQRHEPRLLLALQEEQARRRAQ